jgi:hypothetical protein
MKKRMLISLVVAAGLVLSVPNLFAQPQSPNYRGGYCPWKAQGGAGGQAGWYCPWSGHKGMWHPDKGKPVTQDQAKQLVEDNLRYGKNPNLKVGDLSDKGDYYEADIVTKEGSLVDKLQVNKKTGYFRSAYQ